jgi:hypothetical protein
MSDGTTAIAWHGQARATTIRSARSVRSRRFREGVLRFLVAVDVHYDRHRTAEKINQDDGLSAGDEGDEGFGCLAGDGEDEWFRHSPIVLF